MPTAKLKPGTKSLTSSQRQYLSDFPPGFVEPQLCELVKSPPVGGNWVHEAKLDGYRMQIQVRNGKSTFFSRKGLDWTHRFPEIARACQALGNAIIDGEVCAVGNDGLPTFAGLTDALSAKRTGGLVYDVFDRMAEDTESLISYLLLTRKKALKQLLKKLKRVGRVRGPATLGDLGCSVRLRTKIFHHVPDGSTPRGWENRRSQRSRFFWTPHNRRVPFASPALGRRMKHLEEYAENANECRAMAAKALLPEIRAHLLEMADRWEEMARQRAAHMHLENVLTDLLKNGNHNGNHNGGASAA